MIAIHKEAGNNFSPYWIEYCEINNIPFKVVNCYDSDIISEVRGCTHLLWHINNLNYKDQIFAKHLVFALDKMGIEIFPNIATLWHFDDKVAQKYLLEAAGLPLVPSTVFYSKKEALEWLETASFPKVFKLRKGSGSKGVLLMRNKQDSRKLINTAFGRGFKTISKTFLFKERIRKYRIGQESFTGVLKGFIRLFIGTTYINMSNREKGYFYYQDFIANNHFDTRVIVIGDKAFGIKRMNRKNDFRASGSGHILYNKEEIDESMIRLAFKANDKLEMQCAAFDFVFDEENNPLLVEVSYGYNPKGYRACPGYWDKNLMWHEENIDPEFWMIENLLKTKKANA